MTAKILHAAPVVEKIKQGLKARCDHLKAKGIIPSMCVILVGDNPASLTYVKNKKKVCEEIGASFRLEHLPSDISDVEFLNCLKSLNQDPLIHGIIIQLPVPNQLKNLDLPNLISAQKDIDGFNWQNTQKIYGGTQNLSNLLPCTPKGIITLLDFYGIKIEGKNIVVIGRSLIVGKPLSMLLSNFNATVTLAHSHSKNLKEMTLSADIVVSAIGKAHHLDESFFKKETQTVVIDVGMNTLNGRLTGDVDFEKIKNIVQAITPVPGGVGPMTVVTLVENLIFATENQLKG